MKYAMLGMLIFHLVMAVSGWLLDQPTMGWWAAVNGWGFATLLAYNHCS
jgi:hypothetical protein